MILGLVVEPSLQTLITSYGHLAPNFDAVPRIPISQRFDGGSLQVLESCKGLFFRSAFAFRLLKIDVAALETISMVSSIFLTFNLLNFQI